MLRKKVELLLLMGDAVYNYPKVLNTALYSPTNHRNHSLFNAPASICKLLRTISMYKVDASSDGFSPYIQL